MKLWIPGLFLQGFNQRDLQVLVKLNVLWSEDFRSKVLSVGHLKSRRQPWSVAASRPWPRHYRSTSPSWTSTGNTTTLVPRVPRPGVRLSPLNAAACIHVMSSTFFDRKKCCLFGGAVVHRSSLIEESCQICRGCKQLLISGLFAKSWIREIQMSELNVILFWP